MKKWLQMAVLLAVLASAVAAGIGLDPERAHEWLFTALIVAFWVSDARFWKRVAA